MNQQTSEQQLENLFNTATGGLFQARPAQQIFEMPTPQAQMMPGQIPGQMPPQNQMMPGQMPPQQVIQTPAAQMRPAPQVAPPGSPQQAQYEDMREKTSRFLHGLIDGAMPYIKDEVMKRMTPEEMETMKEQVAKEEVEQKKKFGSFKSFLCGIGGALAGYGIAYYLIDNSNKKEKEQNEDDAAAALIEGVLDFIY